LCKQNVAFRESTHRKEAPRVDPSTRVVLFINVSRLPAMDAIDMAGCSPDDVKITAGLKLPQLAWRQVSAQQLHTALVRWVKQHTAEEQAKKPLH